MFSWLIQSKKVAAMSNYFPGKILSKSSSYEYRRISFCSMHGSGERLSQLTGIAAILRFPMPDLDLAEEHHEADTNATQDEFDMHEPAPNPNRMVNHINNTDANRAEASAW